MSPRVTDKRSSVSTPGLIQLDVHLTDADADAALRSDVARGLTARPKELPPKWFYDTRGSELFEKITELPEYYPFRTERALLIDSVADIARSSGRTPSSSSDRDPRRRPGCCSTRSPRPGPCAGTYRRTSASRRCAAPSTSCTASTRRWRCTAWSATSPGIWTGCPAPTPVASA
ncbi:hypothetical protein Pdca_32250 [Pseudonocardia autotrophica]|nr:hypothetical protein Pdca_32250 [Pseudonocardia autotrophica]